MNKEDEAKELKCDKCNKPTCGEGHCPFSSEINDDWSLCNCCDSCQHDCAMEI